MPYPFTLPTTSGFSFSASFESDTHPSLPLRANTYHGVARGALKRHKRLSPSERIGNLTKVAEDIKNYLPYILAIDTGLNSPGSAYCGQVIRVKQKAPITIKWRPVLSGDMVPGKDRMRVKISTIEHELGFFLVALGFSYVQASRATLQPLYSTTGEFVASQERTKAIATASKQLLEAASVFSFLASRLEKVIANPPCVDVSASTVRAMASLAHAEATILAVLKDDPYPAVVAQDRSKNDKEWMFKSPDIPKVRAHLYARLCLAAAQHAAKAASLVQSIGTGTNKVDSHLSKYIEDFRCTCRAKACRFLGIDAELGGQTAEGIGWLKAGLQELGADTGANRGLSFARIRKNFLERQEDRRVDKEHGWGIDAGKLEETRVIEMLSEKWNKLNDTMNTSAIPSVNTLIAKMPSGREIHDIPQFNPPMLDPVKLENMRAPPDPAEEAEQDVSSDEDFKATSPVGAFPGTSTDYSSTRSPTANSQNLSYF